MSEPRLSNILIGILLVGLVSVGFVGLLANGSQEYSTESYDNSTLEKFQDSADDISEIVSTVENQSSSLGGGGSVYDIFGGFLKSAWISLRTTGRSIDVMANLVVTSAGELPVNPAFSIFLRNILITMFIIIIVIAILFHFIRGSNRL